MEAVNVVTAGLVEDQPSPMHTKEFQTLSEFQSVNLGSDFLKKKFSHSLRNSLTRETETEKS